MSYLARCGDREEAQGDGGKQHVTLNYVAAYPVAPASSKNCSDSEPPARMTLFHQINVEQFRHFKLSTLFVTGYGVFPLSH